VGGCQEFILFAVGCLWASHIMKNQNPNNEAATIIGENIYPFSQKPDPAIRTRDRTAKNQDAGDSFCFAGEGNLAMQYGL
jgi:hypothetical protein